MAHERRRALLALLVTGAALAGLLVAPTSQAQDNPVSDLFTTTTTPAPSSSAATSTTLPAGGESPPGAEDARGDGVPAPEGGIAVPPEAQKIIDGVRRTGSNSNGPLLTALSELVAIGMDPTEAYRGSGLGRFPVAGPARYSHDWLLPRYGPGFRFHLGTDVFAADGTPLRAPVDGIATSHQEPLGGLSVKIVMPDKTYFYLAHLSGLVEGFASGMPVRTGDIVGYVGDSGNAKGGSPHLHIGIYPKGGPPIDPKPVLDQFLADATAHLPELVAAYRAAHPVPAPLLIPALPVSAEARMLRPTLATQVLHPYAAGGDRWSPAALYVLGADPAVGGGLLVQSTLDDLAAEIDWSERSSG